LTKIKICKPSSRVKRMTRLWNICRSKLRIEKNLNKKKRTKKNLRNYKESTKKTKRKERRKKRRQHTKHS